MESGLEDLYRDIILDHYRNPRNRGRLDNPDVAMQGDNPLCGDEIEVSLKLEDGKIIGISYTGQGCSISQASASMMTESVKGKTLDEARAIAEAFRGMMHGTHDHQHEAYIDDDSDLEALQGVKKYPVRVKCAMLSWTTLVSAIDLIAKAKK